MVRAMSMVLGAGMLLGLTVAAGPERYGEVGRELISITKAQWSAEMAKNTGDAARIIHPECTMFVPDFPNRLDGKDKIYKYMDAGTSGSGSWIMADMANEKVQVFGNTAILSYNFMGMEKDAEGKVKPILAKSTRVYVKEGGRWMLVHANYAPAGTPDD